MALRDRLSVLTSMTVATVGAVAMLVPARVAMRTDPSVALGQR
jgi:hypothetical protein